MQARGNIRWRFAITRPMHGGRLLLRAVGMPLATLVLLASCTEQAPRAAVATPIAQPEPTPAVYEVQRGEFLASIAEQQGVPLAALLALNPLADPDNVLVGQRILLPPRPAAAPVEPAAEARSDHDGSYEARPRESVLGVTVPATFAELRVQWGDLTPSQQLLVLLSVVIGLAAGYACVAELMRLLRRLVAMLASTPITRMRAAAARPGMPVLAISATMAAPGATVAGAPAPPAPAARSSPARRFRASNQRARAAVSIASATLGRELLAPAARACRHVLAAQAPRLARRSAHLTRGVGRAAGRLSSRAVTRLKGRAHELIADRRGGRRATLRRQLAQRQDATLTRIGLVDEAEEGLRRLLIECRHEKWEPEAGLCLLGLADVEAARGNDSEARELRRHALALLARARPRELRALRAVRNDWDTAAVGADA